MSDRLPGIRPRPSLWRQLDMMARSSFPATITALMLLIIDAPLGLPGQAELQESVVLASVFFWSLFRPASIAPPGVGVLTLLITHGLAALWRRTLVQQGFLLVWLAFVGVIAGAAAMQWAFTSLLEFRLLPPWPGLFQAVLGAGLYPMLAPLLTRAHRTLVEPDRA
jgi:rod shape-determining protein MreD